MKTKIIKLKTKVPIEILDITETVEDFAKIQGSGILLVSSLHTTVGLILNERCEKLQQDMVHFLKKWAPTDFPYLHNTVALDGRPNAHSHLLSMVLPSQISLSVAEGKIQKGQWQSIFAVELDGPREERKIHLTFLGE